jgi:hypothetical protein
MAAATAATVAGTGASEAVAAAPAGESVRLRVLLFAQAREAVGVSELQRTVPGERRARSRARR